MESRVTIPTIWGAPSLAPLTTGIWLTSALRSRSSKRRRGSSGEVHRIFSRGIMADWTELRAHSLRGTALRVWTFIMPTSRPSLRTRWQRRPVRRTSAPYSSSVMCPSTAGTSWLITSAALSPARVSRMATCATLSCAAFSRNQPIKTSPSRADVVFCGAPDNRAEDPSAIERKAGNEIEARQPDVDESKPSGKRAQHLAIGKDAGQSVENPVQEEAGQRSSDGDVEFLDRF